MARETKREVKYFFEQQYHNQSAQKALLFELDRKIFLEGGTESQGRGTNAWPCIPNREEPIHAPRAAAGCTGLGRKSCPCGWSQIKKARAGHGHTSCHGGQSRAKRAAATATAPRPASGDRALFPPLRGESRYGSSRLDSRWSGSSRWIFNWVWSATRAHISSQSVYAVVTA
jgi:hypothetical protein